MLYVLVCLVGVFMVIYYVPSSGKGLYLEIIFGLRWSKTIDM